MALLLSALQHGCRGLTIGLTIGASQLATCPASVLCTVTCMSHSGIHVRGLQLRHTPLHRLTRRCPHSTEPSHTAHRCFMHKPLCPCPQVNMALKGLPRFTCLPQPVGQHNTTIHLLPDEAEVMAALSQGFSDVQAGRLPQFPTIEWYIHTTVDPSLQDQQGNHNSALFVQVCGWVCGWGWGWVRWHLVHMVEAGERDKVCCCCCGLCTVCSLLWVLCRSCAAGEA